MYCMHHFTSSFVHSIHGTGIYFGSNWTTDYQTAIIKRESMIRIGFKVTTSIYRQLRSCAAFRKAIGILRGISREQLALPPENGISVEDTVPFKMWAYYSYISETLGRPISSIHVIYINLILLSNVVN